MTKSVLGDEEKSKRSCISNENNWVMCSCDKSALAWAALLKNHCLQCKERVRVSENWRVGHTARTRWASTRRVIQHIESTAYIRTPQWVNKVCQSICELLKRASKWATATINCTQWLTYFTSWPVTSQFWKHRTLTTQLTLHLVVSWSLHFKLALT